MWLEKTVELEPLPRTVAKRHYTVGNDLRNNAKLTPSMSQLWATLQNVRDRKKHCQTVAG